MFWCIVYCAWCSTVGTFIPFRVYDVLYSYVSRFTKSGVEDIKGNVSSEKLQPVSNLRGPNF